MKSIDYLSAWLRVIDRNLLFLGVLLFSGMAGGAAVVPAPAPIPALPVSDVKRVDEAYRIQPTDLLLIDVVNERELAAKDFRVTADGKLTYPFIGAITAGGRTASEVAAEIKRLLEEDYLVNAQVLVHVRDYRKKLVSISGQVTRAGQLEIPPERRMLVIEAIAAAGGTTRLARDSDIQIHRAGLSKPLRYSLRELKNRDTPIYVEPDDVIFVPERRL